VYGLPRLRAYLPHAMPGDRGAIALAAAPTRLRRLPPVRSRLPGRRDQDVVDHTCLDLHQNENAAECSEHPAGFRRLD